MLASETAEACDELHDEPFVERDMIRQLHPLLLNGQWVFDAHEDTTQGNKGCVEEHLDWFTEHNDPDTEVAVAEKEKEQEKEKEKAQPYLRLCVAIPAHSVPSLTDPVQCS